MTPISGANPNAVQLGGVDDGWDGWAVGWRPVGVSGSFDVPSGHLAFDQAGVRAVTADGVQPVEQHRDCLSPAVFSS